ncbi:hypothetical protein LEP1GSC171_0828 [Leptospira santarosai str. HAI1380]|nr:Uncharacterized protein XB15_02992 [Leptospira santarosai]EKO33491.1 hypothetical protein LEP1GSC179_2644 [Leptospira santarosai str. MOR084]EMJ50619.1 hypothetical protein LEP1GSC169_3482 [Leptospira santarosai str. HAI1349]EMM76001.1 hypothetical protein LEP1GSC040_3953 [Leptospira santarosai str. 2000030832]EMM88026.1 hypothetical protein LEP1GSC039_2653 [Leptospira santarosai str. 2000027870]EMO15260.1 hypothetical protein LEP1GSC165_0588 [Leptospira santarosai str. CBC523]EMO21679.1 h
MPYVHLQVAGPLTRKQKEERWIFIVGIFPIKESSTFKTYRNF